MTGRYAQEMQAVSSKNAIHGCFFFFYFILYRETRNKKIKHCEGYISNFTMYLLCRLMSFLCNEMRYMHRTQWVHQ